MTARSDSFTQVGRNLQGVESRAKLTGAAVYASDLVIEGMLHAKILRSGKAHALIRSIDVSRALAMPGVVAVVTGDDLAGLDYTYGTFIRDQPVLAVGKVRYVGEPVAAVAALTEAQACLALAAIRIDYHELVPVTSIATALATDAPQLFDGTPHAAELPPAPVHSSWTQEPSPNVLFDYNYAFGDVDAWQERCDHIFEDRFTFGRLSHYALEPHVCLASMPTHDAVEIWSNNQDPFLLRQDISRIFRLPLESVRFHTGLVGGGFGSKSYCKIEPIAVLLARKAGRPVRLALAMSESMMTVCEHGAEILLRSGVSASGETLMREALVNLDGGAYADASPSVAMRIGSRLTGPYRWHAMKAKVSVVRTSTIPAGSFRGFGSAHIAWASESQIDMIARRLGCDPVSMRTSNFIPIGTPGAPDEPLLDSDLTIGMRAVASHVAYPSAPRVAGRGTGFAVALKGGGKGNHQSDACVSISVAGSVLLGAGVTEIGQGTRTALTQIASEVLRVDPGCIVVEDNDTQASPYNAGTHASTGITVSGLAVRDAAGKARAQVLEFAAGLLCCDPADLEFDDFEVLRGDTRHCLADLAAQGLSSQAVFKGEASVRGGSGWMPVWTAAEVEVDVETGAFKVVRLATAVDAGRAINPQRAVSQVEGAGVQGLGQALFEHLAYDGTQPVNATPLKYRVARIGDVPTRFDTLILEQGGGPGPFGAKGLGESGNLTIPAAIANAIADAVGARVADLPITAEKVLNALLADALIARQVASQAPDVPSQDLTATTMNSRQAL